MLRLHQNTIIIDIINSTVGGLVNVITGDEQINQSESENNDLKVSSGLIWGKVYIDTIKEFVTLSNISKEALREIETEITSYMLEAKKQYIKNEERHK